LDLPLKTLCRGEYTKWVKLVAVREVAVDERAIYSSPKNQNVYVFSINCFILKLKHDI
jgi:hypothetical protein